MKNVNTNLFDSLKPIIKNKDSIQKLVRKYGTPFYVFDEKTLLSSYKKLLDSFSQYLPKVKIYYPVKINHYSKLVDSLVSKGSGLDVASYREIDIAIESGCRDMVYFSPGKTEQDLVYALKYSDSLIINLDSFGELDRLGHLTENQNKNIKVGVRVHFDFSGGWKKYGIDINQLKDFFDRAKKYKNIDLIGIHLHESRNVNSNYYIQAIKTLALSLKNSFLTEELKRIKFIDLGGGFEVCNTEGRYVNLKSRKYVVRKTYTIEEYARDIGKTIQKYLNPLLGDVTYFFEPGRFIVNNSMHIVLSVADVKDSKNVILDGGVNMVGWQRFESEYFPLINLSTSSKKEIRCNMWGNLCTTWDIWGYHCYAKDISRGDIIVVPNQGTLTYSLAQNFINKIPPVYNLK